MDCKIHGCVRKTFAAGLCHRHYEEERLANAPPCSVDGCDGKSERAGMCNKHYRQHRLAAAPPCTVDGCGRPQFVGGHCSTHHKRVQRYGSLANDKRAHDRGARERHPLYNTWRTHVRAHSLSAEWKDFWAMVSAVGERPSRQHALRRLDIERPIGPGNWKWLETISDPDYASRMREYRKRNPETFQRIRLKKAFGLTLEDYLGMLDQQGGVCAICKRPETMLNNRSGMVQGLSVDHCHNSQRIRGLLCSGCNASLGKVNDDVEILKEMIRYLEKHK